MQRSWAVVLTAVLVLASGVSVKAQPPGGRGGGRGFGGGFGGSAMLVGQEAVQKELGVTDAQKEKLAKVREEAMAGFAGGGFGGGQNLSDEERAKRRTEMEERAKKTEESIKSILDEKQQARLNELVIQQAGAMALNRPDVSEKLKLTDDQKSKLRELAQNQGGPGRGGFNPNATQEERQKAMEEARARREKATADAMAVLTPEQKKTFEEMQGKKFEFPAFGGFGGGGRGGAGNRPPRQN